MCLSIMKKILDLGEFKLGKKTDDYKFFRREVMNTVYRSIKNTFNELKKQNILETCSCKSKMRHGYSDCPYCGGSGYKMIDQKDK